MKSLRRLFAVTATAALCASAFAASDPTYTALRAARPDGRFIAVNNFTFDRDVYHFTLNGNLHLVAQAGGKTIGAVFVGQGSYALTPATPMERHTLSLFAGDDKLVKLTDDFDRAVFFDAALIAAAGAIKEGTPNGDATGAYEDFLKKERKNFNTNFHIRLLREVLDAPATPLFLAYVHGKKYPPAMLAVDPFDREPTEYWAADDTKGGLWYSAYLKSSYEKGSATTQPRAVTADHYVIDSTIASNSELTGTTTISLVPNRDTRIVEINLMPKLRIQEAAISPAGDTPSWTPVSWIQENAEEDGDAALVLPEAVKTGQKYLLKTTY